MVRRAVWVLMALFAAGASAQTSNPQTLNPKAWVRQFPAWVEASAYTARNQEGAEFRVAVEDVLIALSLPSSPCQTQLVRFSNGIQLGTGFVVFFDALDWRQQHPKTGRGQRCDLEAKAALGAVTSAWPKCEDKQKNQAVRYLIQKRTQAPACIFVVPDRLPVNRQQPVGSTPRIEVGFASPVRTGELHSLSDVFLSAPWPRAMVDAGFRSCNSYNTSPAGYARRDSDRDPNPAEPVRNLAHPALRWAFYYFVKLEVALRCGDGVQYRIDPVDTVIAYLSDSTVLLKGKQSVLRVRLEDGTTLAKPHVKQVDPEHFVNDMRADGGKDCVESDAPYGAQRCKWLFTQGWYAYFSAQQKNHQWDPESDTTYFKHWYQGFDAALDRIYFSPASGS